MLVKKLVLGVMASSLMLTHALAAETHRAAIGAFKHGEDAISYALGASVGRNFKHDEVDVDPKLFIEGFNDAMAAKKLKLSEDEFKAVMSGFQSELRQKLAANQQQRTIHNQERADKFLAENAKKAGVVSLPSGVQYQVLKAAEGKKPEDSSIVEVNYRGSLLDGKQFDATLPGKPANLKLAQLIPGWREAIKLMPVGSKWQLFIPPKLAYGQKGVGQEIGPNELLIFEVELLGIK